MRAHEIEGTRARARVRQGTNLREGVRATERIVRVCVCVHDRASARARASARVRARARARAGNL